MLYLSCNILDSQHRHIFKRLSCFFLIHRLSSNKSMSKPVQLDNLSTSSADSGVGSIQDKLPPRVPPYSKLQDLAGLVSTTPSLTPSPAPLLNVNTSDCFSNTSMSRSSSGSPLLYPRLSGLHRSMESLPLQMSVSPAGDSGSDTGSRHEDRASLGGWSTGSRSSLSITDRYISPRSFYLFLDAGLGGLLKEHGGRVLHCSSNYSAVHNFMSG